MTTLRDYAQTYIQLVDGSDGYKGQIIWTIASIERWAGRTLTTADFSSDLINRYLFDVKDTLSGQTRLSRRNMYLRLWRHAALNPDLPPDQRPPLPNRDTITKVKRRQKLPTAWTPADVLKLYTIASGLWGLYANKVPKRAYWQAFILAAWSTGMRRCDLMELRRDDITPSGRVAIVQKKTGKIHFGRLSPEALAAVNYLLKSHDHELVFAPWCSVRGWRKTAARLVRRAGLKLSIGKLRASSGTDVELKHPGQGHHHLGNTPQVFHERYFDRRLGSDIPLPTSITDLVSGGAK